MLWELRECYRRLPPERVIGISHRASVSHLESQSEAITEATCISSEPWISGLAIYDPAGELRESFLYNLHQKMLGIVVESKKTYIEALELAHAKESRVGMIWPLLHLGRAATASLETGNTPRCSLSLRIHKLSARFSSKWSSTSPTTSRGVSVASYIRLYNQGSPADS